MPEYDKIIVGDKTVKTKSGAIRSSNEGKGRFDLLSVWGLLRLSKHYQLGVTSGKYLPRNWEYGMPISRYIDSAMRHIVKYLGGDRSEDHLAAAAWNLFAIMDHEERIERGLLSSDLNDLPPSIFRPDEFTIKVSPKKKKSKKKSKRK